MASAPAIDLHPVPPRAALDPRPRVLLAEDYALLRTLYAEYLERAGFRVEQAADGPSAVYCATARPPDVILLDAGLPALDGPHVARRLRQDARTRGVPIVLLSGRALDPDEAASGDACLRKPCPLTELAAALRTAMHRPEAE